MKKGSLSVLAVAALTLALLVSACGGTKATTSTAPTTTPPTTTSTQPATTTPTTTQPTTTTGTPTTTTTTGNTLPATPIAITYHDAAYMVTYKTLCQLCHGPTTTNSNPYPPTWDGGKNGSTAYPGVYTVVPGSPADHTNYTVDQCTQPGCHAVPGSATTPPTTSTTTPPTSSTTPPPTTTSAAKYVDINEGAFQPASLTVKIGTLVTFTNNRETVTTLTCDALEVNQPITRNGGTFSYPASTPGNFTFATDEGITFVLTVTS